MKHLKSKLTAAIVMVAISALMLTGVSFAWYTLSTNPEVKNIKATAVANENLEIALDKNYVNGAAIDSASANASVGGVQGSTTNDYYTWGNLVDVTNMLDSEELRPASYNSTINANGLYAAQYGTDGRVSGTVNVVEKNYGTTEAPAKYATGKEGVTKLVFDDNAGTEKETQYALKVTYWLRTNEAGKISLTTGTDAAKNADGTGKWRSGAGSYIKTTKYGTNSTDYPSTALKVLFKVTKDGETSSTWVPAICGTLASGQVPLTADVIESAAANTAYKVEMYVYLDGQVVTNAMAKDDVADIEVNVQFANSAISGGAMEY